MAIYKIGDELQHHVGAENPAIWTVNAVTNWTVNAVANFNYLLVSDKGAERLFPIIDVDTSGMWRLYTRPIQSQPKWVGVYYSPNGNPIIDPSLYRSEEAVHNEYKSTEKYEVVAIIFKDGKLKVNTQKSVLR